MPAPTVPHRTHLLRLAALAPLAALALLAAPALARQDAPEPDAPPPLSGPDTQAPPRDTIVEYEYGGGLKPLEVPPAEAALAALNLPPDIAGRAADRLAARARLVESLVTEHFDLIAQGETIDKGGSGLDKAVFLVRVIAAFKPLLDRGPMEQEVRDALPTPYRERFDAIVKDYWDAVVDAHSDAARAAGEKPRPGKARFEARNQALGKEIEQGVQRVLESEEFIAFYLLRGIGLTPEQDARVRSIVIDFAAKTMGEATEDQQGALVLSVMAYLTEPQRDKLIERIKGLQ